MNQPDRTQAPPFQLSTNYALAQPERFSFPGGQPLYSFRNLQQNVVKFELIFRAGKWYESKSGVSHFTANMLRKGTRHRTSFAIADALDNLGAQLEISAGFDTVTISLFTLKKNFFAALAILLEIIEEPSFDGEELRKEKEIFVQNLRVNNEKTSVVASREIRKTIFGSQHPYGNSSEESDVLAIEPEDLHTFFHDHFVLHSGYFLGPVSESDIQKIVSSMSRKDTAAGSGLHPETSTGISHALSRAGSVQASIRLGKRCIPKGANPDYFDAVMANHILGGYFGSRLMKTIREEKGLTYGIHSAMHHFLHGSFWVISAEVNQLHTQLALDEIRNEIRKLQEEPVPQDELDVARNYFIGSWQSDNSTLFAVAEKIRNIHQFQLPPDYYSHLLGHLQRVTSEQVQRAAREHFTLNDLIEIRVG